jgi:membrane-associated phospholipid phosphatase
VYALELFLWHRYKEMKYATFVIFLGFYLSFIGYLILPAIGPRFQLHNFYNLNNELPGFFLTNFLRDVINFGESIPKDVLNAAVIAQRDAFPSGHTIIIVIIVYLSKKTKSNSFYFYLPYSILLIFSTIYLRYHYVIDIIGGVLISFITILIANFIYKKKKIFPVISEKS